ncbi:MAG: hypothetical protein GY751_18150 [Bacteroidetes bacterium]|nr:hypothetical protein [Bacteroidota bacterium]
MLEDVVSVHVDMSAFEAYATIVLAGDVEIDIDNVEVRDEDTEGLYRGAGAGDNSEDLQEAG